MLILISPAKTLDLETPLPAAEYTEPRFLAPAAELMKSLRDKNPAQLASLMNISDKLAGLNVARNQQWRRKHDESNARPALYTFQGDVYTGLEAASFKAADRRHAQQHLRILSGLYGLLRPLDLIQPYRLEMGTSLETRRGKDLYGFWGSRITDQLREDLQALRSPFLVNLASNEYFRSVQARELQVPVISPVFRDCKNGKYKIISFYAKKARGRMAGWLIRNRIKRAEDLCNFNVDGYYFSEKDSNANTPVFLRDEL